MLYLEIKSLHILLVTIWFAGLFCLPRIFVNLAMVPADSIAERDRQLLMAGKLYRFMTPIGYLALITGLWLWLGVGISGPWMHAKLLLVVGLVGYNQLLPQAAARLHQRQQYAQPRLVPLVQRNSGDRAARGHRARRAQAVLVPPLSRISLWKNSLPVVRAGSKPCLPKTSPPPA